MPLHRNHHEPDPAHEDLPPVIPEYQQDATELTLLLGQKEHYVHQLKRRLANLAHQINTLHDDNLRLQEENQRLTARVAELEAAPAEPKPPAKRRAKKEK